jgi:ABC-type transport system substrate-binding protein
VARAIRITFSEPVEITGFGDTFGYQSPKGKATIFVFTGTPLDEWWTFWISWSPDSAGVVEMEWLKTGGGVQLDINIGDEPPTLDPSMRDFSRSTSYPIEQLFLGLVNLDNETGEPMPELATSWEVSEDATVWTFTLRDDVTWTDGKPVTAD